MSMRGRILAVLAAGCLPLALGWADEEAKKVGGKTDPASAPLEAILKANKTKYTLNLGGKSADEFRKEIKAGADSGRYPQAPAVDLVLELKNTSRDEVKIKIGGTQNIITLDLKGDGAISETLKRQITPKFILAPRVVTLEAGKSVTVPITSLAYGFRNGQRAWWVEPGKYTLSASYKTSVSPRPRDAKEEVGGFGVVTATSAPIELEVEAAK